MTDAPRMRLVRVKRSVRSPAFRRQALDYGFSRREPGLRATSVGNPTVSLRPRRVASWRKPPHPGRQAALALRAFQFRRELEARLAIEKPVSLVVNDIESAIALATDFDERRMNHNFDYDHDSYKAVEKGLKKLIEHGELEDAKRLSIELMKRASYQVACSDEGLMTYEIEDCLKPVIKAVKREGGERAKQWAAEMIRADEVGFICGKQLEQLAEVKS